MGAAGKGKRSHGGMENSTERQAENPDKCTQLFEVFANKFGEMFQLCDWG